MTDEPTKAQIEADRLVKEMVAPAVDRAKQYRGQRVGNRGGRPPKPPPVILKVERLSDGAEVRLSTGADDFTGEAIAPALAEPRGELPSSAELIAAEKQAKADASLALVRALGFERLMPKPVPRRRG